LGQFDLQMSGLFGGIANCSCDQISEAKTAGTTDAVVPDKSKLQVRSYFGLSQESYQF